MKRAILITAVLLTIVVGAYAIYTTGWGATPSVTTTPQRLTGFTLNSLSILNKTSSDPVIFALVNCTTGTLAAAITAGTAVPIPGGQSYTFDMNGQQHISSVCLATTNSSAVPFLGGL